MEKSKISSEGFKEIWTSNEQLNKTVEVLNKKYYFEVPSNVHANSSLFCYRGTTIHVVQKKNTKNKKFWFSGLNQYFVSEF